MPPALRFPLGLAFGLAAACAMTVPTRSAPADDASSSFESLLARYDKAPAGAAKDQLAARIDAFARQKYATVSRLYWHTDFAAAQAAARAAERPILHLRMLGRLDEELSCANSRLFRATLYANREVSRFLRDNFVLYWSAERPVPRVTIDYGDGRKIERTTTGNSAHYVLDADGTVLDVLPGVYAPVAFRIELAQSLALANRVRDRSAEERATLIRDYHAALVKRVETAAAKLAGAPWLPKANTLLNAARVESELAIAQRATVSKAVMEIPDLRYILAESAPADWPEDQISLWASAGQVLYNIGDIKPDAAGAARGYSMILAQDDRAVPRRPRPGVQALPPLPAVLDEQSRALVYRIYTAGPAGLETSVEQTQRMLARLEQNLVADSALNQLRLRPQISNEIIRSAGRADFAKLNAFVYKHVFGTPKEDAWLGLLPRTDFTGIPGDGVVMR